MKSTKNTQWGLYPWWEAHGVDLIHPDDILTVQKLNPGSKVFEMTTEEGGFIRLRYGNTEFRARPSIFKPVSATIHDIGQTVTLTDGRSGEVLGIMWHHKRNEPMYELRIEGKKKSKRYWNSDFVV